MDREEAKIVLSIMNTADGGCPYCSKNLMDQFCDKWPEFKELALEIFENETV